MNILENDIRRTASREAVLCIYSYLSDKAPPKKNERLLSAVKRLRARPLTHGERIKLHIIERAMRNDILLSRCSVLERVSSKGLNAAVFLFDDGSISVVFRGTSADEWADNGEGLSGLSFENTYYTYEKGKGAVYSRTVTDQATPRQAEALNWFFEVSARYGWDESTNICVSGHSKGGNKAQFICARTALPDLCISFDGQGFSPEAMEEFREEGIAFERRRERIYSICAYNDYVNVLGDTLCKAENVFYFEAPMGDMNPFYYHYPEAILTGKGDLRKEREKGDIALYIEGLWKKVAMVEPRFRRFITEGITGVISGIVNAGRKRAEGSILRGEGGDRLLAAYSALSFAKAFEGRGGRLDELRDGMTEKIKEADREIYLRAVSVISDKT